MIIIQHWKTPQSRCLRCQLFQAALQTFSGYPWPSLKARRPTAFESQQNWRFWMSKLHVAKLRTFIGDPNWRWIPNRSHSMGIINLLHICCDIDRLRCLENWMYDFSVVVHMRHMCSNLFMVHRCSLHFPNRIECENGCRSPESPRMTTLMLTRNRRLGAHLWVVCNIGSESS